MSRPAGTGLLLAAVLLTGLNLRGAIAAVSPVLPEVRADLGLSPTVAGLLTTLPVLCFAALAPAAADLGRRLGAERAVLAGLLLLAAATALRVLDGAPVLLAGTLLVGAAMTVGNVLLPPVVKREFGPRAGTVTGLYTTTLAAGAAATAAATAPLAALWGWRAALASWAVLALVAAAVWARATGSAGTGEAAPAARGSGVPVWRLPLAWAVGAVLALQSALYYAVTAWLPSLLLDELGSIDAGAAAATTFQLVGIPGTLVVPLVVRRWSGQRVLGVAVAAAWAAFVVGLLLAPAAWPVWTVVGGLAQGAGIAFAFTLVVLRSADEDEARRLSGMTQLVAYSTGALGPLAVGALYSASGGWVLPLLLLTALAVGYGLAAVVAGRPGTLSDRLPPRGSDLRADR
ncbi:CynX/NimT family MFS transporter [Blastococcus sp. SYSU D00669]